LNKTRESARIPPHSQHAKERPRDAHFLRPVREQLDARAPGDYAAQVLPDGSADTDAIIARMTERGSTVTRADIAAVLEDAFGAITSLLQDGRRVNLAVIVSTALV